MKLHTKGFLLAYYITIIYYGDIMVLALPPPPCPPVDPDDVNALPRNNLADFF